MLAGKLVSGAGAGGRGAGAFRTKGALFGAGGAGRASSPELQLETPKAATRKSTTTVNASRAGVQSGFEVSVDLLGFMFPYGRSNYSCYL